MAELLLINPAEPVRKRNMTKKTRRAGKRKWGSPAQRAALRKMLAARRAGRKASSGPRRVTRSAVRKRARNPIMGGTARRRVRHARNPIALGKVGTYLAPIKDALLGGAGAITVDLAYGQVARFLPDMLQRKPGEVGLGDAVKAVFTVALGQMLAKPTRGMSRKMASGALTVQAAQILARFVPAGLSMGRVGYYSPAAVTAGTPRVNAIRSGVNAYVPGPTPMLNAYVPGTPPMLRTVGGGLGRSAAAREGVAWK